MITHIKINWESEIKDSKVQKRKNRSKVLYFIIVAAVILTIFAVIFYFQNKKENKIEIGAVLSMSGAGKYYGEEVRDGMLLAVEEVNEWGGINGKKIKLVIKDSETDVEEGKNAFHEIENNHQPLLYISILSINSMALAPLAEKKEVLLIGLVTSAIGLTGNRDWVFRYYPMAQNEVTPVLRILKELKVKNLGILYSDEDYGRSVASYLDDTFKKMGGKTKKKALGMDESNFIEQIENVMNMDAIYIVGYPHHLKNIFKELDKRNFNGYKLGASTASKPSIVKLPQSEGAYVVAPKIYDPDFLFAREVKDRYESKYGKPFNHFAANGYDIIKIISGFLEDEEISRANIKNLFEKGFIYPGIFGIISIQAGEQNISFPLHPAQIVDGELKYWW